MLVNSLLKEQDEQLALTTSKQLEKTMFKKTITTVKEESWTAGRNFFEKKKFLKKKKKILKKKKF